MIESPSSSLAPVRIEKGGHRDLDAMIAVMDSAFDDRFGEAWTRSQCAGILPMPGITLAMARCGSNLTVGFALQRIVAGDGELLLLAVDPSHRRRGIGRDLLRKFLVEAQEEGCSRVHLEVRDGNPAVDMYQSAGFKIVGRRRKYYHGRTGGQFDALTLSLEL
ncbi:MAG TPA: GNAT family N-acetyltransferase [Sphingomicrobium sp.]|nr:GNAT family N-acetyltransferase [Sphingomicrobium sp.]